MRNLKSLFKDKKKSDIARTYLLLGISFLFIVALNLYAYLTIVRINEIYTFLNRTAINIRLKVVNANLLFREIAGGVSDKDMNAVWSIFDSAANDAQVLTEIGAADQIPQKLETFKNAILTCYLAANNKEIDQEKLKEDYDNAYSDITDFVIKIEDTLNEAVEGRLVTIKILYSVLIINLLLLFGYTVYSIRRFIASRMEMERNLEATKNSLSMIFNSIDSILFSATPEEVIIHWNKAAEKYFDLAAEKVINHKISEMLPFFKNFSVPLQRVLQLQSSEEFMKEKITINGTERFINLKMSFGYGLNSVVILIEDVTVQEMKDSQARQAQKMQVVENMIKSLAHDFNNVLGGITGTISMMKYSIENKSAGLDDFKSNIEVIESSAEKAYVMVQQLLSFSQKHEMQASPVDLNSMVRNVLKICDNTFDKDIRIKGRLYDVKAVTKANPVLIEMALLNLCDNAAQAMTIMREEGSPNGGILELSVDKIYPDKNYRQLHPQAMAPSYWIIGVSDNGVGIDTVIQSKIFDPFFTTKEKYKASGIGLSVVNDIVRQHNGFIEVQSQPGKGSVFSMFIPEITSLGEQRIESERTAASTQEEQIPTGTGLILVADDEEVMRKTAKGILAKLGYEVIFAEDGEQTVQIFSQRYNEIAAILLDMTMPKMSGKDAYIRMKEIFPKVKVLLVSGFVKDKRIEETLALGINGFIQKPYTLADLAKEMKRIINS